jgi:two-component system LytT family response regulator
VKLRAYIVDDEPLAIDRLTRLLAKTNRVEIAGATTNPLAALESLRSQPVEVLFLDIQMPGLSGFELLAHLPSQPMVIFTTAYDQYALKAFEVNSVDYLLKPIDPEHLERALNKAERLSTGLLAATDLRTAFERIEAALRQQHAPDYPERIAARIGERVCFIDLARVTHFHAEDKLTYAVADGKAYSVDHSISGLEERLDPKRFLRIHRATLVNADWVKEIAPTFAGGLVVRLKDQKQTDLMVARNRAREVKARLGF